VCTDAETFVLTLNETLRDIACDSVDTKTCAANINTRCAEATQTEGRRLQQAHTVDYEIVATYACQDVGCTGNQDIANYDRITEVISTTIRSSVHSGSLASELLQNPIMSSLLDCLVIWGGSSRDATLVSRDATLVYDENPVIAAGRQFYPVSSKRCQFITFYFSEIHILIILNIMRMVYKLSNRTGKVAVAHILAMGIHLYTRS